MSNINWPKFQKTYGSDEALKKSLIEIFQSDIAMRLKDFQQALNTRDFYQMQLQSHTIKSSSAYVGAEKLELIAKQIENSAKQQDLNSIVQMHAQLNELFTSACNDLNQGNVNVVE